VAHAREHGELAVWQQLGRLDGVGHADEVVVADEHQRGGLDRPQVVGRPADVGVVDHRRQLLREGVEVRGIGSDGRVGVAHGPKSASVGELRARRVAMAEAAAAKPSEAPEGLETREVLYGQSAAFVHHVRPAAEVVRTVSEEAERIVRFRPSSLLA
jgi:hypothetical protein